MVRGIAYVVVATVLFIVMNVIVKRLSGSLPVAELIWARTMGHLIFVVALFAPGRGGWRLLETRRPAIQVARSLLLLISTSFFFSAIGHVPLADATAVSFTSPFIVAAVAGRLLGERVTRAHWISIAVGFAGALIIIRPTGGGTHPAIVLVLGSAACYALYQVLTRLVVGIDSPETSVTYSALVGTLVLSVVVPFVWRTPAGGQWLMLAILGLLGGIGHYFVARALLWGPASVIAPFHYVQLVWAAIAGYVMFGDAPSAWTWLGAAIVIGSGLSLAWREAQRP